MAKCAQQNAQAVSSIYARLISALEIMCDLAGLQNGFEDDGWDAVVMARALIEEAKERSNTSL